MNIQERMIDRRTFRITVIALAAAAVLVLAAYLYGAGLRADTPASVAPSALGVDAAAASSSGLSAAEYAAKSGVPAASILMPESVRASSPAAAKSAAFRDSSADFYGKPATSSRADPYRNAWMGFTAPESVAPKLSVAGSAADPSTSIKPEGINPAAAVDSAAKQVPWLKPEGIKVFGTK